MGSRGGSVSEIAWSPSVWASPGAPDVVLGPLPAGLTVDLAVVGGGLLGLSTALSAARRGLSVCVVEAGRIAGRSAGLSGGQVIPGLKHDPDALRARFGEEVGNRLVRFVAGTATTVFDMIEKNGLDVPVTRTGWIQAAHTETAMRAAEERARQWQAEGADVAVLGAADVALLTGAEGYLGGFLDRRAGSVDPRRLTLALLKAARAAGARVFDDSLVTAITRRDNRFQLATRHGATIAATRVLVAANAYSDRLIPGLARTLVPLNSFQIATAPLPRALDDVILPQLQPVADSRRIRVYFRRSP